MDAAPLRRCAVGLDDKIMLQHQWLRNLPNGKKISALGFGCSSIWSTNAIDDMKARSILLAAIDNGVNHFDTGASYGLGLGEERLGDFLKDRLSSNLIITTKVGSNLINSQIKRDFNIRVMTESFEGSLKRLGTDHVDILYLHGPSISDLNDDVFSFFEGLKRQGRISYSGVNSFDTSVLNATAATPIDAIMLQYNVSDLSSSEQIDALHAAGKIVFSGTAMGRAKFSLSTFFPTNRINAWYLARMIKNEPSFLWKGPRLAARLAKLKNPPTHSAIQFVTGHPKILSSLFGTSTVRHMIDNAQAGHGTLTEEQWNYLARG